MTIAASRRETRFLDPAVQLAVVRMFARVGGGALLLFCVVDDHLHLVLYGTREGMGRLASRIVQALTKGLGIVGVESAHILDVDGRKHLENLVPYVLTQTAHHNIAVHPAEWRGSCLADLVGARRLEGFDPFAIARALPRWEMEERVLSLVGLGNAPLDPVSDEQIASLGAETLWKAAGAAIGTLAPTSNDPIEAAARVAYAHLVKNLPEARDAAGLSKAGWSRLVHRTPDDGLVERIRRNLALDLRVQDVMRARPAASRPVEASWA